MSSIRTLKLVFATFLAFLILTIFESEYSSGIEYVYLVLEEKEREIVFSFPWCVMRGVWWVALGF